MTLLDTRWNRQSAGRSRTLVLHICVHLFVCTGLSKQDGNPQRGQEGRKRFKEEEERRQSMELFLLLFHFSQRFTSEEPFKSSFALNN